MGYDFIIINIGGLLMKTSFFNKKILKTFGCIASWILALFSAIVIFIPIDDSYKWWVFGGIILLNILAYVGVYVYYKKRKKISLKIGSTKVVVKIGDIFQQEGKKVVAFNEYFDTQVDDIIIAKGTLNGMMVEKYINDLSGFDNYIENYLKNSPQEYVEYRSGGKKIRYELGTVVPYDDFLLLAFSRFDENQCAFLENDDIARLYLKMWSEIDRYKACYTINLPLLGSRNIVRKFDYTPQQLLELLLWSFRISNIKFSNNATLNIILDPKTGKQIDFTKLTDYSD